eukprot:TRINITY_DN529_c0_g1_i3.p1 TRINITY_DN529_c0_g1~~TRINITY_DN529_c0_g1_i3.p1  ORF type:complete len:143 (-),score=17.04 TRINITY_DN529_c0_g1_i3:58-486(-)
MKKYMALAFEEAEKAKEDPLSCRPIGAVIVDPVTHRIVTTGHDQSNYHPLHHASMVCIQRASEQETGYLCTAYDLYITKEPCVMCSMALLHSRIGRVIYGVEDKEFGGLGGKVSLHTMPSLNHHFQVFKGLVLNPSLDDSSS